MSNLFYKSSVIWSNMEILILLRSLSTVIMSVLRLQMCTAKLSWNRVTFLIWWKRSYFFGAEFGQVLVRLGQRGTHHQVKRLLLELQLLVQFVGTVDFYLEIKYYVTPSLSDTIIPSKYSKFIRYWSKKSWFIIFFINYYYFSQHLL